MPVGNQITGSTERQAISSQFFYSAVLLQRSQPLKFCIKRALERFLYILSMVVCVEVLWPSQHIRVMSSRVTLPNHTFPRQA